MAQDSPRRTGIALSDKQRIAWLRLIRSDNAGPATFRDLINHFGSAETALEMLPEPSRRGGSTRLIRIATKAEAVAKLDFAEKFGARFLGIGEAAHRASIETGTIAAIVGGLDQPYPPANVDLLHQIWDGNGLAISEMQFGWEPRARDFPRRNRLIAGAALGQTPVEIDDIIRHTQLPASSVYLVLLELDFAGQLHRHPGGLVLLDSSEL